MARPATVISNASTTSSPLPTEFKTSSSSSSSKEESRNSATGGGGGGGKSKSMMVTPEDLPLPEDMDWPSLVDTATRVMLQVAGEEERSGVCDGEENNVGDASITSG